MAIRMQWTELPAEVTRWVESELGGAVVTTRSQANGFSSGTADRVETAGGRRAFVKALSRQRNAGGYELHRRETVVMRSLPATVPAPRLLGSFDDGEWVALILEDVDGTHPRANDREDVRGVLDALATLPLAVDTLSWLPRVNEELEDDFHGWNRIAQDGADAILSTAARELRERIVSVSVDAFDAVDGESLVHLDCRVDNILVDPAGKVRIVDWPWASVGAPWLDALTYLLDVSMRDLEVDVEIYLDHPIFETMTSDHADAALAGLAGAFYDNARAPALLDMPTLRSFQKAEGDAAVEWLSRRWDAVRH